jgi:hypothetical protein
MTDRLELTKDDLGKVARALNATGNRVPDKWARCDIYVVVREINKVLAQTAVSRSLARDLKRLTESNTPYDDQARDLLGS